MVYLWIIAIDEAEFINLLHINFLVTPPVVSGFICTLGLSSYLAALSVLALACFSQ